MPRRSEDAADTGGKGGGAAEGRSAALSTQHSALAWHRPQLHLVTDGRYPHDELLRAITAAAANGVDWVHVRDPRATARDLYTLAREVTAVCMPLRVRVAVNDRVDVALAAGVDGVQLGERSLPPEAVRPIVGSRAIGVSVHDAAAAARAEAAGADWLLFGHVFPTASHPGMAARGVAGLAEVVRCVRLPVIAIGGVGVEQVPAVMTMGAAGIAVISAILDATDPGLAAMQLRQALDTTSSRPD